MVFDRAGPEYFGAFGLNSRCVTQITTMSSFLATWLAIAQISGWPAFLKSRISRFWLDTSRVMLCHAVSKIMSKVLDCLHTHSIPIVCIPYPLHSCLRPFPGLQSDGPLDRARPAGPPASRRSGFRARTKQWLGPKGERLGGGWVTGSSRGRRPRRPRAKRLCKAQSLKSLELGD